MGRQDAVGLLAAKVAVGPIDDVQVERVDARVKSRARMKPTQPGAKMYNCTHDPPRRHNTKLQMIKYHRINNNNNNNNNNNKFQQWQNT